MQAPKISELFDQCFVETHKTRLLGGADEPFYQPDGETSEAVAKIHFRENYASSALHEVAHWCIAGKARRRHQDYGYWYEPDRDADQQRCFESAECRPQALEWIFSEAAGITFRVSCDNFDESTLDLPGFRISVQRDALCWLHCLPARADQFLRVLVQATGFERAMMASTYQELPK